MRPRGVSRGISGCSRSALTQREAGLQSPVGQRHFNARVDSRSRAAAGERLRLALDTSRLYFFDRSSGRNLTASSRPRR